MYAGKIMESGTKHEIFRDCRHPYTWALLSSIPSSGAGGKEELYTIKGTPPDLLLPLDECPFSSRCEYCMPICREQCPDEYAVTPTHGVSCWLMHPDAPEVEKPENLRGERNGK